MKKEIKIGRIEMKTTSITVHTYPELSTIQVKVNGIYKVSNIAFRNNRPRFIMPTIVIIFIKIKWEVFTKWLNKKYKSIIRELI